MTRITLDGFSILKAIGENRDAFSEAEQAVDQAAQKILVSSLKNPSFTLERLRAVRRAIGTQAFGLLLDKLGSGDLKRVLKKTDPYFVGLAEGSEDEHRTQIDALAAATVSVSAKPNKPAKKAKAAAKSNEPDAAWPLSMSAKPSRRR